ncbi:zf-TFIIB domain-containing protein [Leptothoe kymatousa]|uniref:Zf-TFIIB domain-containing protein n=1 Tax=Leptothoe kymatousa TAU-MAC 1615 TaxID=2364775 RepID=A0ABS5Y852_9CYAN|nr:zf-TFIIB domain-containing protein [Leptothoe kymatousa]MBT9313120.1 zf-TFIIB domain-containing protein [Leptothoe kymatousa TAU-MAC 1615]
MHCPCCQTSSLKRDRLNEFLAVHACEACEGQWISSYDYWHWLEWETNDEPIKPCDHVDLSDRLEVADNSRATFCPECHHLMRRAKVGHGLEFYLDRCSHCGGSWFDKGEWEILKACNIHNKVHLVFSEPWQSQIRQAEFNRVLEETYRSALGDDDYAQALGIRAWLEQHPHRDYIISLLNQIPPAEDESRYVHIDKAPPQNDLPKPVMNDHHSMVAGNGGGVAQSYEYPQPAK